MAQGIVTTVTVAPKPRGVVRTHVALTCAAGAISAQSIGSYWGRLVGLVYDETAGSDDMTSTADVLITDAHTGASLIADLSFGTKRQDRPTMPVQGPTGTVVTAADTANDCRRDIFVAGKINIAIANATGADDGYIGLVFEEGF